jgi:hypothetical protein
MSKVFGSWKLIQKQMPSVLKISGIVGAGAGIVRVGMEIGKSSRYDYTARYSGDDVHFHPFPEDDCYGAICKDLDFKSVSKKVNLDK